MHDQCQRSIRVSRLVRLLLVHVTRMHVWNVMCWSRACAGTCALACARMCLCVRLCTSAARHGSTILSILEVALSIMAASAVVHVAAFLRVF